MRPSRNSSGNNSSTVNGRGMAGMSQQNKRELVGLEGKNKKDGRSGKHEEEDSVKRSTKSRGGHSSMFGGMERENGMGNGIEYAKAYNKKERQGVLDEEEEEDVSNSRFDNDDDEEEVHSRKRGSTSSSKTGGTGGAKSGKMKEKSQVSRSGKSNRYNDQSIH
jgi:hypothetical protein